MITVEDVLEMAKQLEDGSDLKILMYQEYLLGMFISSTKTPRSEARRAIKALTKINSKEQILLGYE